MLSKKRLTITGKKVINHNVNIKPAKARKIIRRFHVLISKRRVLCDKLGITLHDNDEEHNMKVINKFIDASSMQFHKKTIAANAQDEQMEAKLLKAHNITSKIEQLTLLKYIMNEIYENGGLKEYQLASRVGQDNNRGGDSSKKLVEWLKELKVGGYSEDKLTALEIGSLSVKNHISTCGIFSDIIRIDLANDANSQGILKQDFMARPLPKDDSERFDLISCSLVLNFVPTPIQRGDMCLRFEEFLKNQESQINDSGYVFIVLPLPCMNNSRYMDNNHFCNLMSHLGYTQMKHHEAKKICYFLFKRETPSRRKSSSNFTKKTKIHDKPGMNNFTILLQ